MITKRFVASILLAVMILMVFVGGGKVFASTNGATISAFDNFSSTSYILLDANSGKTLVQFNDKEKLPVASICKLMTSLITLENIESGNISLDDMVLVSQYSAAVEGSQAFLDAGSQYSVRDLLKSVVVASANDSAIALAEHIAGSEESFVDLMNSRASELGMVDTHYTNATGLTTLDQYSTAYDTCLVLREINKYDLYGEFARIWMDSLTHPSGRVTELVNTNRLIKYYPYCIDGKTGFTDEAGYCLSSVAQKDDLKLIAVTLNCKDAGSRFYESMKLYDYGFANYMNNVLIAKDEYKVFADSNYAKSPNAILGITEDLSYVCAKSESGNVELVYNIPEVLNAPMKSGDIVGNIVATIDGKEVASTQVQLLSDLDKANFKDIINKLANNWKFNF